MAKDIYHDTVRTALEKDGWTITDDPLRLTIGRRGLYVDLGAEKLFAAEKEDRRIAVEIKSFLRPSPMTDLEDAVGQYVIYSMILQNDESDRLLYLAVSFSVYRDIFTDDIGQLILSRSDFRLLVFDEEKEEIKLWIP
jgi:hypothetical protein